VQQESLARVVREKPRADAHARMGVAAGPDPEEVMGRSGSAGRSLFTATETGKLYLSVCPTRSVLTWPQLTLWVEVEIVHRTPEDRQVAAFEYFIDVAGHSRKFGDLYAANCILRALLSPPVDALSGVSIQFMVY
jgi:hypothetical protein